MNNKGHVLVVITLICAILLSGLIVYIKLSLPNAKPEIANKNTNTQVKQHKLKLIVSDTAPKKEPDLYIPDYKITTLDVSSEERYFDAGTFDKQKYRIKILPGWKVKREQSMPNPENGEQVYISLAANPDYFIAISQGGSSGYVCLYNKEDVKVNPNGGYNGELYNNFTDVVDQDGHKYRVSTYEKQREKWIRYDVCEYRPVEKHYALPTATYESIHYQTPRSPDTNIIDQMNLMLASIKNLSSD